MKKSNKDYLPWILVALLILLVLLDLLAQNYGLKDEIIVRAVDMLIVALSLVVGYYFRKK
jgi:hypothetical protein